ncbi:hypothetical protein BJ508DRAFT_416302 [Ascobolus immersus RN42]|uniref:N-acetylglucosamine-induced protein 1 n=1 Tax=Ascobolus immersus RN42 TaxID=1160509 RepID=A0A3N4HYQ2_ASCIM|nr:hypothetical protein BJ508DRAFT_416302 [Ascobolus immersus RN42]
MLDNTTSLNDPTTTTTADTTQRNGFHVTLTAKDAAQLATPDAEFKLQTWEDLQTIIAENRIADLKRVPSDLRRYLKWSEETKKEYGSIKDFILQERLKWTDLTPKDPVAFRCEEDTKILLNDWPYGNAKGIYHLVVWTKASIDTCPPLGDLTPESRQLIQEYVSSTFNALVGDENVLWFKNWASIQSVRSVEHVHVLVRNCTEEHLAGWVGEEAARVAVKRFG